MPDRILVLAPNWLGDAVMALPALQSIRAFAPGAQLIVAARPSVAALYPMVGGVDAVVPLDARRGAAVLRHWKDDAQRLAEAHADLAVLFPNSFLSAWITAKAGVPERWGYATDGRGPWLTRRIPKPPSTVHQADYYLAIATGAGVPAAPRVAHVRVTPEAQAAAAALVGGAVSRTGYLTFAPGAAYGFAKQWPPERFAELALLAWRQRGLSTVLVGAAADAPAGRAVRDALHRLPGGPSVPLDDLIARTDLAALAAVFAASRAVVANDSGAMHLAAAVGVPLVAIFGPTRDRQTAPLTPGPEAPPARLAIHPVWCRPCMLRECPLGHACMRGVSAAQVFSLLP